MKKLCYILFIALGMSLMAACGANELTPPEEAVMQDGEYEGLGEGRSGMIKVAIEVKNHILTAIRILSQSESRFAQPAEQQIIDAVLAKQTIVPETMWKCVHACFSVKFKMQDGAI